jgi:hypothetical protein
MNLAFCEIFCHIMLKVESIAVFRSGDFKIHNFGFGSMFAWHA